MSYIPYTPGMETPLPGASVLPPKRSWAVRLGWIICILVCVVPPVIYLSWRLRPRLAAPPLAIIPLPDGTQLRLVGTRVGSNIKIRAADNFQKRVYWEDERDYGSSILGSVNGKAAWMIFTVFDPTAKRFSIPSFEHFEILSEPGMLPFAGKAQGNQVGSYALPPVNPVSFPMLPRRASELKVKFSYKNKEVEGTLPNPFLDTTSPAFRPEPLPQVKEVDGVQFEFRKAYFIKQTRYEDGQRYDGNSLQAGVTVKMPGFPNQPFDIETRFFDPTGNETEHGALPSGDRVWGVKVTAKESLDFPFPPDRCASLGKLPVPAAGQVVKLVIPPKLKAWGMTDAFALGTGIFQWGGGKISIASGVPPAEMGVAEIEMTRSGQYQSNGLGLLFFYKDYRPQGPLRVRCEGQSMNAGSSMSSAGSDTSYRAFSNYYWKNNRKSQPGDALEIEVVFPKPRTVKFYFERPKFPGE